MKQARELTDEETEWIFQGLPRNVSIQAQSIPTHKLVELFDIRAEFENMKTEVLNVMKTLDGLEYGMDNARKVARVMGAALMNAGNDIHSEYCGQDHSTQCNRVRLEVDAFAEVERTWK
jgi:hypothetical protein